MLTRIDFIIIVLYFLIIVSTGLYVSKKVKGSIDEYFLGGRRLPWFILGLSGMATYVDMSGTMLQCSFYYMLGAKGFWICFRGGVALVLAFLMVFMGKWLNRSRVMTNAQWMEFRFGSDRQGEISRLLSAISSLVFAVALIAFLWVGAGKFLYQYIPLYSPNVTAGAMFAMVMIYTVSSGFFGVVYTDILQALLIIGVIIFVVTKALTIGSPEYFSQYAPDEWRTLMLSSWEMDMPVGYENMRFLGLLVLFWIFATVFQGFAVPFDSWTSQKYYAAKDERESSLVAFLWIVAMSFRFLLFMGIGVLALGISDKITEPEMTLPAVINEYIPAGLRGLLFVALIAAAMSTLEACVNSSSAYFVKDVYQHHINPGADRRHLMKVSYIASASIMIIGAAIGWNVPNINCIWAWIAMGLITGMLPPNVFKWFWWRSNGMGYAVGMGAGVLGATVQQLVFPVWPEYTAFCFVVIFSTIGTIVGTLIGKPTPMNVLIHFYKTTRPFGFWGPVRSLCDPDFVKDVQKENRRDILLLFPACIFQVTIFWIANAFVIKRWDSVLVSAVILALCLMVLYKYWYKNLKRI